MAAGRIERHSGETWVFSDKTDGHPSMERADYMDSEVRPSTPEPLFMDKCGKKPLPSTIMAFPVDKWQKKWPPSTFKHDYVDGEAVASMKTALSSDD